MAKLRYGQIAFQEDALEIKNELLLNNVDNTSDADKPISTATQLEIDSLNSTLAGVIGGYQGKIAISDTPTNDGFYIAVESGTYTNAGNLVVTLTNMLSIIVVGNTQTTFELIEIPVSLAITGVVEEGNEFAVSGGEVFKAVDSSSLISSIALTWQNGYISITGTWNSSASYSYCEIDVSELNTDEKILVSTILNTGSSIRMLVFVDEQNNVVSAIDKTIDVYNDYIPAGTKKIYINSNRLTTDDAFFIQKKDTADIIFANPEELSYLRGNVEQIRKFFNPTLTVGYIHRNGYLVSNSGWRNFTIQASDLDLSSMLYFRTFDTTAGARGIIFYDEDDNRINISDEYQNEYYSYIPPNTHYIVCNVPATRIDDFIFSQNKIENYLAKKYNNNQKNAIYSWWMYPLSKRVYIDDNDFTFFGYVANTGEVSVGKRDNNTLNITNTSLRKYTPDDHNACCVEIADDGSVIVAHASGHSGGNLIHLYKSVRPYDISEFNYNSYECGGLTTYSQLVKLSNKTAWFYRHNNGGLHLRIITDDYTNVSAETQLSIGREYALFRKNPDNDWILCIGTPHPSTKQTVIAFYIDTDAMVYRNINGVDIGDIADGLVLASAFEIADATINTRLLDVYPKSTSNFDVLMCRFTKFSAPFDGVIYSYKVEDNLISEIKEVAPQGHPMYIGSNYVGGGSYMQDGSILIANNNNVDKWDLLNIKDNDSVIIDSITRGMDYSIGRPYESLDGQIIYHKGYYNVNSYTTHRTSIIFDSHY